MKPSFLTLLAAGLAAATKQRIAWRASVDTANASLSTDSVGDNTFAVFVSAPIVVTRLASQQNSVVVTGVLQPVGNNTDGEIEREPQVVFVQSITVSSDTTTQDANFNFNIPTPWMDHLLSLSVSVPGSQDNTETNGLVVTRDAVTDTFVVKNPGEWDHDENVRIIAELEAEPVRTIPQEPSDLGEEPGIPDDGNEAPVDGKPKSEDGPGQDPGQYPGTSPGQYPTDDEPTTTVTTTKTTTLCPTETTVSPHYDVYPHPRQLAVSRAVVNAKVTFTGWNGNIPPLRLMQVTAWGSVYNAAGSFVERVNAFKTLDVAGTAQFAFDLRAGQRIVVDRLVARLEGDKYMVGTRAVDTDPLVRKTITLALSVNPWRLAAGQTASYTNNYPRNVLCDGLLVADAFQRIADFARTKVVAAASIRKVDVWFPSTNPGTFLRESPIFINIPHDDARDPDVLAHEYGHYMHLLARGQARLAAGGSHSTCNSPTNQTALSEGYASAFGLLALDLTILANPAYGQYTDKRPDGSVQVDSQFETYTCGKRTLQDDEGRITAAIFDLADRRLDTTVPAASDDSAQIWPGFNVQDTNILFPQSLVLWRAMRNNPQDMTAYWGAVRALMTTAAEAKAWNVLRYNWADIARSPAAP
ncbi:hypothetical protein MN608_11668 [Microdochium nivale]|nr:hypothetical protein MN608_11668 [Microdochium nivale]